LLLRAPEVGATASFGCQSCGLPNSGDRLLPLPDLSAGGTTKSS